MRTFMGQSLSRRRRGHRQIASFLVGAALLIAGCSIVATPSTQTASRHLLRIASNTKTMTAAVIMQLAREGSKSAPPPRKTEGALQQTSRTSQAGPQLMSGSSKAQRQICIREQ